MALKLFDQTYIPRNEFSFMKQGYYAIMKQLVTSMAIMPVCTNGHILQGHSSRRFQGSQIGKTPNPLN